MPTDLLPQEIIQQIEDYPNYYITSFGRVWSTYFGGHWLHPTINQRGNHKRLYVSLGKGNKKMIHKLVAQAFLPNPNNLPEIDHIDADGMNNHVDNLRWVSHTENMDNIITIDNLKKNTGYLLEIEEISTGRLFKGYKEASQITGLHEETIRNHTKGKVKNPQFRLTGKKFRPTT